VDPERNLQRDRRAAALLDALESLPPHLREAFTYCDLQGVPIERAAEELGIKPGNLRVRAHRARARIRKQLIADGWIDEGARS
jgi:RNA polymerase sigma-70 factor (ECF subfamily)